MKKKLWLKKTRSFKKVTQDFIAEALSKTSSERIAELLYLREIDSKIHRGKHGRKSRGLRGSLKIIQQAQS